MFNDRDRLISNSRQILKRMRAEFPTREDDVLHRRVIRESLQEAGIPKKIIEETITVLFDG